MDEISVSLQSHPAAAADHILHLSGPYLDSQCSLARSLTGSMTPPTHLCVFSLGLYACMRDTTAQLHSDEAPPLQSAPMWWVGAETQVLMQVYVLSEPAPASTMCSLLDKH